MSTNANNIQKEQQSAKEQSAKELDAKEKAQLTEEALKRYLAITPSKVNNVSQEFGIMITLQENLNLRIGKEQWKKYISSVFWYYISMPINFTITLFTALSSGQVGTSSNFLSERALFAILFTSFILSTINTFFKLKETSEENYKISQKFSEFAIEFEDIYFTPIKSNEDVYKRLISYKQLQNEINEYCRQTKIDNVNYLTEVIYSCCKAMCFRSRVKLINISERFWILDGKKKCEEYNKKFLIIDMNNFEYNIEKVNNHDFDLPYDVLKSEHYLNNVDSYKYDTNNGFNRLRNIFGNQEDIKRHKFYLNKNNNTNNTNNSNNSNNTDNYSTSTNTNSGSHNSNTNSSIKTSSTTSKNTKEKPLALTYNPKDNIVLCIDDNYENNNDIDTDNNSNNDEFSNTANKLKTYASNYV
jgi:hypothetical protein